MKQRKQKMNGEIPPVVEEAEMIKTRDRFDLEQEIMECWKVVNDIQMYVEQGAQTQDFKVLAEYYERKFDRLWDTFEQLVRTKQL
jgi:hypothetical protein